MGLQEASPWTLIQCTILYIYLHLLLSSLLDNFLPSPLYQYSVEYPLGSTVDFVSQEETMFFSYSARPGSLCVQSSAMRGFKLCTRLRLSPLTQPGTEFPSRCFTGLQITQDYPALFFYFPLFSPQAPGGTALSPLDSSNFILVNFLVLPFPFLPLVAPT